MKMFVGTQKRYRLSPSGEPYTDLPADVEKEDQVFSERYIETVNNQTKFHGRFIEIDEAKTKAYHKEATKHKEELEEIAETEKALAASKIAEAAEKALQGAVKSRKKPGPKPKTQQTETE